MKIALFSFSDSTNIGDILIVDSLIKNLVNKDMLSLYSFNFNKVNQIDLKMPKEKRKIEW